MLSAGTPWPLNQDTPSCTRSNFSAKLPDVAGSVTVAFTVTDAPGATGADSSVRAPSHTKTAPDGVKMWYARSNCCAGSHAREPAFVRVTGTVIVAPRGPSAETGTVYTAP